jgi:hypothetical protein
LAELIQAANRLSSDRKNCIPRKGAKGAKDKRFEARNPKFETNSNNKNRGNSKQTSFGFGVLDFPDLKFVRLSEFVSDFDIRISDLFSSSQRIERLEQVERLEPNSPEAHPETPLRRRLCAE